MNFYGKRVLVTGAAGGIGSELVAALLNEGADVLLTGRNHAAAQRVAISADPGGARTAVFAADLTSAADRKRLCEFASQWHGGIDVLINNAGISDFSMLTKQAPERMEAALLTNLLAPMDLCRQLLPSLGRHPEAHIVNIGSVFGSIGFAANSVYCATKFGLRGFSEALRRELADSTIRVHYLAPRATRTELNSNLVEEMNAELGNATDDPAAVAQAIVHALSNDRAEQIFGWPENFFARLNALLPRLVDSALARKLRKIQHYARRSVAPPLPVTCEDTRSRRIG